MSLYRRLNSPHWWTRFQLEGSEVRLSTGTGNRREAEEFETVARTRAWRLVRLGERPPFPWRDAAARWLAETRKRSKRRDESILAWFDEHLNQYDVHITREVVRTAVANACGIRTPRTRAARALEGRRQVRSADRTSHACDVVPDLAASRLRQEARLDIEPRNEGRPFARRSADTRRHPGLERAPQKRRLRLPMARRAHR
jgi:hypothetical protein